MIMAILSVIAVVLVPFTVSAYGPVIYEQYTTGDDSGSSTYISNWHAQSFTVGTVGSNNDHKVPNVNLYGYIQGSSGTVTVSIRAASAGKPTGADLCSGTRAQATLPTSAAWIQFNFSSPATLSAGTQYAIVVRATSGTSTSNCFHWRYDTTSATYAGGNSTVSANSGSAWSYYTTNQYDFLFKEYGNAVSTLASPSPSDGATGVGLSPILEVTATDVDTPNCNLYWATNASGTGYQVFATNLSISPSSATVYRQTFTTACCNGTKYWWKVSINDGTTNTTATYSFTTSGTQIRLGYTTAGASTYTLSGWDANHHQWENMSALAITIPADQTGTIKSISAYMDYGDQSNATVIGGVYDADMHLLAQTSSLRFTVNGVWATMFFTTSPTLTAGHTYYIAIYGDAPNTDPNKKQYNALLHYTSATGGYKQESINTWPTFPDPATLASGGSTFEPSIYVSLNYAVPGSRVNTQVMNRWLSCGNTSSRINTQAFNRYLACGNASTRVNIQVFNRYLVCGNTSSRSNTQSFNRYLTCGNTSTRSNTRVFNRYLVCGNTSTRVNVQVYNRWLRCGNTSSRVNIQVYNRYIQCGNTSSRIDIQVFNRWLSCGNTSIRADYQVFSRYLQCGNANTRINLQVYNRWLSCGNIITRTDTLVFDCWLQCKNDDVYTPIERNNTMVFNASYRFGNHSHNCFFTYTVDGCSINLDPAFEPTMVFYQWTIQPMDGTTILGNTSWISTTIIYTQIFTTDNTGDYQVTLQANNSTGAVFQFQKTIHTIKPLPPEAGGGGAPIVPSTPVKRNLPAKATTWFTRLPQPMQVGLILIAIVLAIVSFEAVFHLSRRRKKKAFYRVEEEKK